MPESAPQAQFAGLDPSSSHRCVRLYTCVHPDYSSSVCKVTRLQQTVYVSQWPGCTEASLSRSCSLVFAKLALRVSCLHAFSEQVDVLIAATGPAPLVYVCFLVCSRLQMPGTCRLCRACVPLTIS